MTDQVAIARHVARLFGAHPYLRPDQIREGTQAYASALVDIPSKYIGEAIAELAKESERLPNIPAIRKLAIECQTRDVPRISGPGTHTGEFPWQITARAQKIYRARLEALHAATAQMRAALCAEFELMDGECKARLEQEIKTRLWRAAHLEATTGERAALAISEIEKTGWRERCETWSRLSVNRTMLNRQAGQFADKETERASHKARVAVEDAA